MKQFRFLLLGVLLFSCNFIVAQNKVVSNDPKCCPDTTSPTSGDAGVYYADVFIEKASIRQDAVSGIYTFTATVTERGDDCSHCVKIIVLLPSEVDFISATAISDNGKRYKVIRCHASLIIDGGMICPPQDSTDVHKIKVTVKTTRHTTKVSSASFAIMAYGKTPDVEQKNNYWNGTKP